MTTKPRKWRKDQIGMRILSAGQKEEYDRYGESDGPAAQVLADNVQGEYFSIHVEESKFPALVANIRGDDMDIDIIKEGDQIELILTVGRKKVYYQFTGIDQFTKSNSPMFY